MKMFNVWISRLDGASGLRVDSLENAKWLLCRLSDFFVFKTSEPLHAVSNSADYTFRVAHNSQLSGRQFEKVLAGIAEACVIVESAQRAPMGHIRNDSQATLFRRSF
jgi:hypothetical protein